ncbi:hypothetical protein CMO96_00210 [Candidatus Woesebacteria bacterium]|nr:hypothetical protein [Candidatus Woesebacteria bacterium]|tara:strand:+ start:50 stop:1249 length:1200 start_codon:yes stop_codon:yes gene_type:complete
MKEVNGPVLMKATYDEPFAELLSKYLNEPICKVKYESFQGPGDPMPNSPYTFGCETKPTILESVRGRHVFLVGSVWNTNHELFQTMLIASAAKHTGKAKKVTYVPLYLPYSREEKTDSRRGPPSMKTVLMCLKTCGVDETLILDLHSEESEGTFGGNDAPDAELLWSEPLAADYISRKHTEGVPENKLEETLSQLKVLAPDFGAMKDCTDQAVEINKLQGYTDNPEDGPVQAMLCGKTRSKDDNSTHSRGVYDQGRNNDEDVGNVKDDILASAGTLITSSSDFKASGFSKINAFITHGFGFDKWGNSFFVNYEDSDIDSLTVTNSHPYFQERFRVHLASMEDRARAQSLAERIDIMDVSPFIGEVMRRILVGGQTIREMINEYPDRRSLYNIIKGTDLL